MLKPILLVEDNPYDQELALVALERAQLANETIVVDDGVAALDYLLRRGQYAGRTPGNPACVLLDMKLPKLDGADVLKTIRTTPAIAQVPVVMLTGSREEQDVARSYALGVNAYIVKPMEFSELVKAVADIGAFWAILNVPPPGSIRCLTPAV
ncbi:response regulator [Pseudoduganella flava]|nr:response regulator [Pseudoduganella flava]QGZ38603.1 response regulator [Pseudoduganella flava]